MTGRHSQQYIQEYQGAHYGGKNNQAEQKYRDQQDIYIREELVRNSYKSSKGKKKSRADSSHGVTPESIDRQGSKEKDKRQTGRFLDNSGELELRFKDMS